VVITTSCIFNSIVLKLYVFIYSLKPIDVLVMKKLHHKVNIVPLLAKSDILTPKEVKRLKAKVYMSFMSYSDFSQHSLKQINLMSLVQ